MFHIQREEPACRGVVSRSKLHAWPAKPTAPCSPHGAQNMSGAQCLVAERESEARPGFSFSRSPSTTSVRRRTNSGRLSPARGRPSDRETLTSRLIDRPIPPAVFRGFPPRHQAVYGLFL